MLCTLIGAIILSINIQVGLNMHHMMTSGMHHRPFEGRRLVSQCFVLADGHLPDISYSRVGRTVPNLPNII